jgi:hypothetical protein
VLKLALRALSSNDSNSDELVAEALRHAERANSELREPRQRVPRPDLSMDSCE